MKPNEEIMEFLKENPTFYLATVDGYLPACVPSVLPCGTTATCALPWQAQGRLQAAFGQHEPRDLRRQ